MDPARWRRWQPILDEVRDLTGEERRQCLDRACAGDPELRAQVEALLKADAETAGAPEGAPSAFFTDALTVESPYHPRRDDGSDVLLPGTRVANRYRIVSLLGRGGMGEVYRADDLKLGQGVALKFLPVHLQRKPDYLERLLAETKLARQVAHPNVCRVYDIGEWHGRHFLSMEYIDGEDLASLITRIGHLPRQKALDIARQLCAGLDAAHQLGILHRDLKPANVMLDGRGRVRVTDFGLAVATSEVDGVEASAGTPAYMAPEQFEGRSATVVSDIYALGLVLYELFTGRRAYPSGSIAELQRMRDESSPTRPSLIVDDFDPVVERAILRCLERDPALRPASVRDVAALLPGGDPIAAALAAGETPSPDLIAASGPDGVLRPATAFGVLGGALAMLVVLMWLVDRASMLGWVSWPRSIPALEDNARGILQRLGWDAQPVDRIQRTGANYDWFRYVKASNASPDRWMPLRQQGQLGMVYFYRQAPRPLVPTGPAGLVFSNDPPRLAGDAQLETDLRGRLTWMLVQPNSADPALESTIGPDWAALFHEAGLDPSRFEPVPPTRSPSVASDVRAAWSGVLPDFGGYPVRIEAAAHRGKPVFFELVVPWDPYWKPGERAAAPASSARFFRFVVLFAILLTVSTTVAVAIRNWFTGRGDRHGALRVSIAVFALRFLVWILGGHHVPVPETEWLLLLTAVGVSLTDAAVTWAFYLALEPYARRVHPRFLVSWTRVLRGRVRDPLVGRDILCGVAAATVMILFTAELWVIIPHALGMSSPPAPAPHPLGGLPFMSILQGNLPRTLLGGRFVLEALPALAVRAFGTAFFVFMLFLGLHFVLRKRWATVIAMLVILSALGWTSSLSDYHPVGIAGSVAGFMVMLWAFRAGLVGTLVLFFCLHLWLDFPVTANLDAPHFGTGLVAVLCIVALGAYGAFISSRPAFATASRPDLVGHRA